MIPVTIVCGPPGSGKSSYVEQRIRWGDIVIDMDKLWVAISGQKEYDKPEGLLPYVLNMRDGLYRALETSKGKAQHVWIIAGLPKAEDRNGLRNRFKTENVIVLETPHVTCLRNIRNDPRREQRWEHWQELVGKWWMKYEKDECDKVIKA